MNNLDGLETGVDTIFRAMKGKSCTVAEVVNDETTECDPNGIDAHAPGAKLDAGKPDASLLGFFGLALLAVSEVGTYGAKKYTRGGWQEVSDGVNRYTAAMLRHYLSENQSRYDSDLPVLHAAQVAWNALARLELMLREEQNDRHRSTTKGAEKDEGRECSGCERGDSACGGINDAEQRATDAITQEVHAAGSEALKTYATLRAEIEGIMARQTESCCSISEEGI